jgi:NADPH:quinone reductase-like Zn-dependent oxidoreductase
MDMERDTEINVMQVILCARYGPPEVLRMASRPIPVPGTGEVRVRVLATAVNSGDVRVRGLRVDGFLRLVMRVVLGFTGPRKPVLGTVFAGVVDRVGEGVTDFRPGDEIFGSTGFGFGTYAEYVTLPAAGTVALKPASASFGEAAAIIFGGMTAIWFLEKAGLKKDAGQRVLIVGASGSVGMAAVEIARLHGARVSAVCGPAGKNLIARLGVEDIRLYTEGDISRPGDAFDIVFDAVGEADERVCKKLLRPGGKFVTVGGLAVAKETREQLEQLRDWYDQGLLHAHIDRCYAFDDMVEAHRYVDTGRKKGNVVVEMGEPGPLRRRFAM